MCLWNNDAPDYNILVNTFRSMSEVSHKVNEFGTNGKVFSQEMYMLNMEAMLYGLKDMTYIRISPK